MKKYSNIDFNEVNHLLDLMEGCYNEIKAIRKSWEVGYGEG